MSRFAVIAAAAALSALSGCASPVRENATAELDTRLCAVYGRVPEKDISECGVEGYRAPEAPEKTAPAPVKNAPLPDSAPEVEILPTTPAPPEVPDDITPMDDERPAQALTPAAPEKGAAAAVRPKGPDKDMEYTVRPGDSLWSIADSFYGDGVEWERIAETNVKILRGGHDVRPGMKITIPAIRRK